MARKKLLLIYYSMTGQTLKATRAIARSLRAEGHDVDMVRLEPLSDRYTIPFSQKTLFSEWIKTWSGRHIRVPMKPLTLPSDIDSYDLVIIGFQTWFLQPSVPVCSWLESPNAKEILRGKQVISVVTARDAWKGSYRVFKRMVRAAGGEVVDNLALCSHNPAPQNFLLLYYMLFNGKNPEEGLLQRLGTFGIGPSGEEAAQLFGRLLGLRLAHDLTPEGSIGGGRDLPFGTPLHEAFNPLVEN